MFLTENGDMFGFGENSDGELGLGHTDNISRPSLVMTDVAQLQGNRPQIWSPENHSNFSRQFKDRILYFLLVHKRKLQYTKLRIPKFVLYMIFKQV